MRMRLNIRLPEDSYNELTDLCETYRFNSVCELVTSLVELFLKYTAMRSGEVSDLPVDFSLFRFDEYRLEGRADRVPQVRINLTLREPVHRALMDMPSMYGFASAGSFVVALIDAYLDMIPQPEDSSDSYDDIGDEITEMFEEFADYEPTPANTNAPKIHRTRRK